MRWGEMQVLLWWPLLDVSPPLNPIELSTSKAAVENETAVNTRNWSGRS